MCPSVLPMVLAKYLAKKIFVARSTNVVCAFLGPASLEATQTNNGFGCYILRVSHIVLRN